jgi:Rps23 Pro-64 3,4-dihydroxylase Tpa1-like proline 4-hydroxylase
MTQIDRKIMNIECRPPDLAGADPDMAYKMGHRDARHAATEIALGCDLISAKRQLEAAEELVEAIKKQQSTPRHSIDVQMFYDQELTKKLAAYEAAKGGDT